MLKKLSNTRKYNNRIFEIIKTITIIINIKNY